MNQQQMTREIIESDNESPDIIFSPMNTIWDQSANIFAAVINNARLLPDDRKYKTHKKIPSYIKDAHETSGLNNKMKTPLTKLSLACLQEEHAMWLK